MKLKVVSMETGSNWSGTYCRIYQMANEHFAKREVSFDEVNIKEVYHSSREYIVTTLLEAGHEVMVDTNYCDNNIKEMLDNHLGSIDDTIEQGMMRIINNVGE